MAFEDKVGGFSVFNLGLNVAGILLNKKNVSLYIINEKDNNKEFKQEILQPIKNAVANKLQEITGLFELNTAYMNATIIQNSKLMEHPVEDGTVCADYKVKMPTEISIQIVLPAQMYEDIINEIQEYKDKGQMIYVETKYGGFKNMQIVNIPIQLKPDNISRLTLEIKFKQVLVPKEKDYISPKDEEDTNTISSGTKALISAGTILGLGLK